MQDGETSLLTQHPDALQAWVRLSLAPPKAYSAIVALLEAYGSPQAIFRQSQSALSRFVDSALASRWAADPDPDLQALLIRTEQWLASSPEHHVLTLADSAYPSALLSAQSPPLVLYGRGQLSTLQRPSLAMVGARNATVDALENAQQLAQQLSTQGVCIVSGLALGVDSAAHRGALGGQGSTIAVMGTGIDRLFPATHKELALAIQAYGLLLSEFPLGTPALPHHFPQRNRLVAALGQGVLVVQAAKQSGSLITARLASEMGREVFAIPGSIRNPLSQGCHQLIRQGAKLVETVDDILEELPAMRATLGLTATQDVAPKEVKAKKSASTCSQTLPPPEGDVSLLALLGTEPFSVEKICTLRAQWSIGQVMQQLAQWQMQGWVDTLPDGQMRVVAAVPV